MGRTINYALKNRITLDRKSKEAIKRLWDASNCDDLYDGVLYQYLQVAAQRLEQANEKILSLERIINDAQFILKEKL